ncbi:MAG: hypothetical protein CM15mP68_3130 [Pseudomonadota bacterium]|nr:MAG: hypothetical protein CM15mP68_3130 [Pseudomonadota bacterium]
MAPSDKAIAYIILDSIDDNGMLVATVDEICASLADPNLSTDEQVTADDVEWVLQKIQQFDPIGVEPEMYVNVCCCNWPSWMPLRLG